MAPGGGEGGRAGRAQGSGTVSRGALQRGGEAAEATTVGPRQ